jgi:hypothetical protein
MRVSKALLYPDKIKKRPCRPRFFMALRCGKPGTACRFTRKTVPALRRGKARALSALFLAALIGKRAGCFAGRLARGLAFAAARLRFLFLERSLYDRFHMLHAGSSMRFFSALDYIPARLRFATLHLYMRAGFQKDAL